MVGLGDIALEHQRADASSLDFMGGFLCAGPVAEVINGDIHLEIGERERDRSSDAPGRSGDKCAFTAEFEIHLHLQGHNLP